MTLNIPAWIKIVEIFQVFYLKKFKVNFFCRITALDMGLTKAKISMDKQNGLALIFKSSAHPAGIAFVQHLIKSNACILWFPGG